MRSKKPFFGLLAAGVCGRVVAFPVGVVLTAAANSSAVDFGVCLKTGMYDWRPPWSSKLSRVSSHSRCVGTGVCSGVVPRSSSGDDCMNCVMVVCDDSRCGGCSRWCCTSTGSSSGRAFVVSRRLQSRRKAGWTIPGGVIFRCANSCCANALPASWYRSRWCSFCAKAFPPGAAISGITGSEFVAAEDELRAERLPVMLATGFVNETNTKGKMAARLGLATC